MEIEGRCIGPVPVDQWLEECFPSTKVQETLPIVEYEVLCDALQTYHEATPKAFILHRDLSDGNILIDKNGQGMLIDWDLCAYSTDDPEKQYEARRKIWTGMWRYMAARLLTSGVSESPPIHSVRDDIESMVHILFYIILRYHDAYPDEGDLQIELHNIFDFVSIDAKGYARGGTAKLDFFSNYGRFSDKHFQQCIKQHALVNLMLSLRQLFTHVYATEPSEPTALTPMDAKEYDSVMATWKAGVTAAETALANGTKVLKVFDICLAMDWPSDNGAKDRFPDLSSPAPPVIAPSTLPHSG